LAGARFGAGTVGHAYYFSEQDDLQQDGLEEASGRAVDDTAGQQSSQQSGSQQSRQHSPDGQHWSSGQQSVDEQHLSCPKERQALELTTTGALSANPGNLAETDAHVAPASRPSNKKADSFARMEFLLD
jgi:hypothetical protein